MSPSISSSVYRREEQRFAISLTWGSFMPVRSSLEGSMVQRLRSPLYRLVTPVWEKVGSQVCETRHSKEDAMRRIYLYFLAFTIAGLNFLPSSRAQETPGPRLPATATAAPTSGFRAEFLEEVAYYEQRYTRLAEAMPAEKYAWHPSEGVRSVGEVFTHIIAANYAVALPLAAGPPPG